MPHPEDNDFSAPTEQQHDFAALLFDMDGTIIDSTAAIVKFWRALGKEIGVDGDEILKTSHGRRTIEMLQIYAPELANWPYVCAAEGTIPRDNGSSATEIPGARKLLASLDALSAPWAIVTSGTSPLVSGWLDVMKLARPRCLVSAEKVAMGKPDPECYLLGAKELAVQGKDVLVLEDAPAGVRAGKTAGFKVLGLATTHAVEKLREAGADWIVRDLRSVRVLGWDAKSGRVQIEISDALKGEKSSL